MAEEPGAAPAAGATTSTSNPANDKTPAGTGTGTGTASDPKDNAAGGTGAEDTTLVTTAAAGDPKDPAKPGEGKKTDDTPQGAPEKYADFKLPDGFKADPETLKKFQETAKTLGLPQDKAQKLVDFQAAMVGEQEQQQAAAYAKIRSEWKTETLKALGANATEEMALVAKTRDTFGSPELNKLLNESGFGDHPAVVKFFAKMGKAISEDTIAEGNAAGGEKSHAERLFPNHKPK